jgi:hypothetical protein
MGQKPLLAFAIALILASTGCLGFGDDELEQQENDDDEQEPVGETNMTSLEKRIIDLEATIVDYEQPRVYFMEFNDNDSYSGGLSNYYVSDLGGLLCISYNEQKLCSLYAMTYDINGIITSYSWEGSETDIEASCFTIANSVPVECYAFTAYTISLEVCQLEPVDQTLTLTVYDNDGNSASASYDLDYDSACTVVEPDNTCASDSDCPPGTICQGGVCVEDNLNVCEDGEQSEVRGMIRTCEGGVWGVGQSIICGWNYNVTNNVCVPCPEGSVNEAGDFASGMDTTCDTNHPPEIASIYFDPYQVTNETETVCLIYEISDPDDDQLFIFVIWLINNEPIDELEPDQCFDLASYTIEVGDYLAVDVTVHDNEYTATETWFTEIEEESE